MKLVPGSMPSMIFSVVTVFLKLIPVFCSNYMPFNILSNKPALRRKLELLIKLAIFLLLFASIYYQVFHKRNVNEIWGILSGYVYQNYWVILLVLLLMPLNWALEAWKWHLLINRTEEVSYGNALRAVFAGTTFTLFTPNRIGEYGGRFIFLKQPLRPETVQATVLGSIAQILVTLVLGICGAWFLWRNGLMFDPVLPQWVIPVLMFALGLLIWLYFKLDKLYELTGKFKWMAPLHRRLATLIHFTHQELRAVLRISFLRYMVYAAQFVLLLYAFGIPLLSLEGFAIAATMFLLQTAIPSIAAFDLGVRGNVALFLLASYAADSSQILAATLTLWAINLVLPAIVGYAIILLARIFKSE